MTIYHSVTTTSHSSHYSDRKHLAPVLSNPVNMPWGRCYHYSYLQVEKWRYKSSYIMCPRLFSGSKPKQPGPRSSTHFHCIVQSRLAHGCLLERLYICRFFLYWDDLPSNSLPCRRNTGPYRCLTQIISHTNKVPDRPSHTFRGNARVCVTGVCVTRAIN